MPSVPTRVIPAPLPPPLVETVRAAGWELVPAGWMRRQLDDRDRLRQQLEAQAPRPTRVIRTVLRDPIPSPENTQD